MSSSSDALITALIAHLVCEGVIDGTGVASIAARLDAEGAGEAAHLARCALMEAEAPSDTEWQVARARAKFRVIAPDGGNNAG